MIDTTDKKKQRDATQLLESTRKKTTGSEEVRLMRRPYVFGSCVFFMTALLFLNACAYLAFTHKRVKEDYQTVETPYGKVRVEYVFWENRQMHGEITSVVTITYPDGSSQTNRSGDRPQYLAGKYEIPYEQQEWIDTEIEKWIEEQKRQKEAIENPDIFDIPDIFVYEGDNNDTPQVIQDSVQDQLIDQSPGESSSGGNVAPM